jgi:hypothetical protein
VTSKFNFYPPNNQISFSVKFELRVALDHQHILQQQIYTMVYSACTGSPTLKST